MSIKIDKNGVVHIQRRVDGSVWRRVISPHSVAELDEFGPPDMDAAFRQEVLDKWDTIPVPEEVSITVEEARENRYHAANSEYVVRGLTLTGTKVRGATPQQTLSALAIKEIHRKNPGANILADLHDKLETLKDAIEVAPDPGIIDVTDDSHWI